MDADRHCSLPLRHILAPHTADAQVFILNHSYKSSPLTSQFSQLPVSALNYSPFHPCFEPGLKEPCLVFLLLTCALCNNDSGSFPKLPGATLGKGPRVQLFHPAHLTWRRETQTKSKSFLCQGCHKWGELGLADVESFSLFLFSATSSTGLRFCNVLFLDIILNTFSIWETSYLSDSIILSVLIRNADAPPHN